MVAAAARGSPVSYETLIDEYLSEAHRDNPGTGCPFSALAPDIARSSKETRALVTRQIRDDIELLATLIRDTHETDPTATRSQAVLTFSRSSVPSLSPAPYPMNSSRAKY
jgi:TetR/AcrR family transcriptional repressor of nem operon